MRRVSRAVLPLSLLLFAPASQAEVLVLCNGTYTYGATATSCSTAVSSASGDLATGQARAVATSIPYPPSVGIATDAYLRDTITVSGPWSAPSITAILSMDVTGSVTGSVPGGEFHIGSIWSSYGGGIGAALSLQGDGSGGFAAVPNVSGLGGVVGYGSITTYSLASNEISYRLEIPITLTSSAASFYFQSLVRAYPYGGPATVDFGHTGQMDLLLPEGYAFTSASGVFLADAPSPVPLPAAGWLMAAGLGTLIRMRRRPEKSGDRA